MFTKRTQREIMGCDIALTRLLEGTNFVFHRLCTKIFFLFWTPFRMLHTNLHTIELHCSSLHPFILFGSEPCLVKSACHGWPGVSFRETPWASLFRSGAYRYELCALGQEPGHGSFRTTEGLPWFLRCQWKSCFFSTWGKLGAEDCFDCRALQRKAFSTCCWPSCTVRNCEWIDGLGPKYIWERMVLAIIIPWRCHQGSDVQGESADSFRHLPTPTVVGEGNAEPLGTRCWNVQGNRLDSGPSPNHGISERRHPLWLISQWSHLVGRWNGFRQNLASFSHHGPFSQWLAALGGGTISLAYGLAWSSLTVVVN